MKTKRLFSALGFLAAMCLFSTSYAQLIISKRSSPDTEEFRIQNGETYSSAIDLGTYGEDIILRGEPGETYTISEAISGDFGIELTGGTLVLTGENSYKGGTTITGAGAIIRAENSSALGMAPGPLTISDNGKLELTSRTVVGLISLANGAMISAISGRPTLQGLSNTDTAIKISGTLNLNAAPGSSLILRGTGMNVSAVGVNVASDATINSNGDVTIQGIGDGIRDGRQAFVFNGNANLNAVSGTLKVAGQGPTTTDNTAYGMVQNGGGTIITTGTVSIDAASGYSSSFSADQSPWNFKSSTGTLTLNALASAPVDGDNRDLARHGFGGSSLGLNAAAGSTIIVNEADASTGIYANGLTIATGDGTGIITINSTIRLNGNDQNTIITGAGSVTMNNISAVDDPSFNHYIIYRSGNLIVNGAISGDGVLTFSSLRTTLNGENTFVGKLFIRSSFGIISGSNQFTSFDTGTFSEVSFVGGRSLPPHPIIFRMGGETKFDGATYTLLSDINEGSNSGADFGRFVQIVTFNSSKLNVGNPLAIRPITQFFGNVELGQTEKKLTLSGVVGGSGTLKKTGEGAVVFDNTGANLYAGTATIEGGAFAGAENKNINVPKMDVVVTASGKLYSAGGSAESVFTVGDISMAAQASAIDVYGAGSQSSKIVANSFSAPQGFTINVKKDFEEGDYVILSSRHTINGDQPIPTLGDRAILDASKSVCFSWDGNTLLMQVVGSTTIGAASSTPTLCVNTRLADITHTSKIALVGEISNERLPSGLVATAANKVLTISGRPTAPGTFDYTVTIAASGGRCPVVASGKITVTDANGSPNTSTASSSTAPVCANTPLTSITHTTTGATGVANAGQAGVNGLPIGVSARWADNQVIITGTPLVDGSFPYTIPLTGGCGDANVTGTITVTSDATGGNSVGAASSTPSLCVDTPLTPITHATAGATGVGTATGLPTGVTAAWANNTLSISGTPSEFGVFNYRILVTGGCGAVAAMGKITVFGRNTPIGSPSNTPTVCPFTRLPEITHSTVDTGVTGIAGILVKRTFGNETTETNSFPGEITATWKDNAVIISGVTGADEGTFDYTIELTSSCGAGPFQAKGTINVVGRGWVRNQVRAMSNSANATFCVNSEVPNVEFRTLILTGIGTPTGLPPGVTAKWIFGSLTGVPTLDPIGFISLSGKATQTGTFNYAIPGVGGCGNPDAIARGTLVVTEPVVGAGEGISAVAVDPTLVDQKLCVNKPLSVISYKITGASGISGATVAGANGLPPGVAARFDNNVVTISGNPTEPGVFNFKIPLTGSCGQKFAEGTITALANIAGVPSSTPTLCVNTPLTSITHSTVIAGASGIGNATGLPNGVTAAWANGVITISGTPTVVGIFNYSIPLTFANGAGCGAATATGTITVTPDNASRTNTGGAASSVSSVCAGSSMTPITHNTTGATGIGTPTGFPTGVTARWANNLVTISGSPIGEPRDYSYTIPLTGGCGVVSVSGVIKITPPTGTPNTVTEASNTSTACINTALTPVTHTTTGATGIGTPTRLPAGVTARWANNVITVAGAPTEAGTFNYEIPLAGGCSPTLVIARGTINVSGNAVVNWASQASSTPTVCANTALAEITHTTTGATGIGPAFGLPNGLLASWANNKITIKGTPTQDGTFAYRIPLTGSCGAVEAMGTITVLKKPTVGQASATPTLVVNTALTTITHTTTDASSIGNATNLPQGVTARWANNSITISGTPTSAGSFAYSIPVQGCGTESVNAVGRIVITLATAGVPSSNPASVVLNTPITPDVTILTNGATGIGTPEGLPPGVTASFDDGVISISGTPTDDGIYNYRIPLEGGGFAEGTIVVTPPLGGGTPSSDPATVVVNTPITPPITIPADGATGIGTPVGLPPGVTATLNNGVVTISGTPTDGGTFDYWIPLEGGGFVEGRIVVTPPTASEPSRDPATVAINRPLEPGITIATQGANGIIEEDIEGLPTGVTATFANGTITLNGTPTEAGTFNYLIPLEGGGYAEGTIVVAPPAGGTPSSDPAQVVVNTPIVPAITIPTDGATGIGTPEDLPEGIIASIDEDTGIVSLSGRPTEDGTFDYWIPLAGGGFVDGRIVVTPPTAGNPSSDPASVTVGTPIDDITISTQGATGIGTAEDLPPGVTASFDEETGEIALSGTPSAGGTFDYRIPLIGGGFAEGRIIATTPTPPGQAHTPVSVVINTPITPPISVDTPDGTEEIGTPVSGLPPGVTADIDENGNVIISGTPTSGGSPENGGAFDYEIPLVPAELGPIRGRIIVTPPTADERSPAPAETVVNTPITPAITIPTVGTTGIGTPEGLPPGVTASFANGVITLNGTPTEHGSFDYRIPLVGGGFADGRIIVTPPTAGDPSVDPASVTVNSRINPPITIPTEGTDGIGEPIIGLPPGVTASWDNGVITLVGTPTSAGDGSFDYRIPLNGGGFATGTIFVTQPTAGSPSEDPALVVVNTPISPAITIRTGATGIETPVTGLPEGVIATFENGVISITGTPTAQGPFDYRIPLTGGGFADGRIMVTSPTAEEPSSDPAAVVANVQIAPPITIATNGTNGIGEPIIGLPPGVTASFANGVITLSGTPTGEGTFDYRIPLIGGGFATGTINVLVRQSVTEAASSPTLCINVEMVAIDMHKTTGATGIGAATDLPAGLSATWANNTITIKGKPTTAGVFNYKIPLVGGVIAVNATGTITVIGPAVPEVTITGFEDGITALLTSSATSGNHQWFKNGAPIADATTPTYTVNLRDEFGLTNKELAKDKFMVKVTEGGCTSQSAERTLGITTADEPSNTSRTVVVYPNPVTDQTTVLLAGYEGRKTIALYNLMGEKLSQQQIDGDSAIISLASYPSGTYIVKVAGNNSEKSVLVIKQ